MARKIKKSKRTLVVSKKGRVAKLVDKFEHGIKEIIVPSTHVLNPFNYKHIKKDGKVHQEILTADKNCNLKSNNDCFTSHQLKWKRAGIPNDLFAGTKPYSFPIDTPSHVMGALHYARHDKNPERVKERAYARMAELKKEGRWNY